ncbi:aminotransferase class V-fold PLP-dependent enzyme [Planctomycetota bacterium]
MHNHSDIPATIGSDKRVRLLNGEKVRYVNLDNTATTPAFVEVKQTVDDFLEWYASVHRGSGYKSFLSTWLYEQARKRVGEFFGYEPGHHIVIFTNNTTGAINKVVRILQLTKDDIVLTSRIEHSSNELPWRQFATRQRYESEADGTIVIDSIERRLRKYGKKVKLIAVTGASNVTGYIPPYHDIAEIAHRYGVPVLVDCAQLASHRRIEMLSPKDPKHLDFIAFSAHKMQAPFGVGALIGPREIFEPDTVPSDEPGGDTTDLCTEDKVYWAPPPARFESGTPNAVGVIALAKSLEVLNRYGMDRLAEHGKKLWLWAVRGINKLKGVTLYVDPDDISDRTPNIPFNIEGYNHGLTAAILGFEYGIGVRHGRLCADELVRLLLGFPKKDEKYLVEQVINYGRKTKVYGLVRASIGICNTDEDIERLVEAVGRIVRDGSKFEYEPEYDEQATAKHGKIETGDFRPKGFTLQDILSNADLSENLLSLQNLDSL